MKAQIAFAADGHAERPVAKHLNLDRLPARAADSLADDGGVYLLDLVKVKLAREHYGVGKLRVESNGLNIGNVGLSGDVDFHSPRPRIEDGGNI